MTKANHIIFKLAKLNYLRVRVRPKDIRVKPVDKIYSLVDSRKHNRNITTGRKWSMNVK